VPPDQDGQTSACDSATEKTSIFGPLGRVEDFNGRAVFVPDGYEAAQIWSAAKVLESEFDIAPYTSQHMAVAVLIAAEKALADQQEPKVADVAPANDQQVAEPTQLD